MMFAPFCPTHDSTVLMTRRNVVGFANSPDGPVIHWRCNCGHEGIMSRSGAAAAPANSHVTRSTTATVAC